MLKPLVTNMEAASAPTTLFLDIQGDIPNEAETYDAPPKNGPKPFIPSRMCKHKQIFAPGQAK